MNFKICFRGLLFLLFLSYGQKMFSQKSRHPNIKSISLLNSQSPDTCIISCITVSTYTCPPCPPGMQCKPCVGDHIMVSDAIGNSKKSLRLFTTKPESYTKGKKYTFLIKLHKTGDTLVNEATLLKEVK